LLKDTSKTELSNQTFWTIYWPSYIGQVGGVSPWNFPRFPSPLWHGPMENYGWTNIRRHNLSSRGQLNSGTDSNYNSTLQDQL